MGQKTHPVGFRLGISKTWNSRWFSQREFVSNLEEDIMLRRYVQKRLSRAGVSKVEIERRTSNQVTVNIQTARPGIVIGRKGMEVDKLRDELKLLTKKDVFINIIEIKHPELEALIHKVEDGDQVDMSKLSKEEQDYVKTAKVILGHTLYSDSWLDL